MFAHAQVLGGLANAVLVMYKQLCDKYLSAMPIVEMSLPSYAKHEPRHCMCVFLGRAIADTQNLSF